MKQRWWWIAAVPVAGVAFAQSSANFQVKGGRVTATSHSAAPSSPGFRADGGVNADGTTGVASSMNFNVASGVTTPPELLFRNGFEN